MSEETPDWTTIRVRKEARDMAQEARGEDETWSEYLLRCADEPQIQMSEEDIRRLIRDEVRDEALR